MAYKIPFNRPFMVGTELSHIAHAVTLGNIAADGHFTRECSRVLEESFDIHKVLMTPSCTAALEMAAILCNLEPGDEVIVPSYTFVSTVSAFARFGAQPVFVDVRPDTLNIDENLIEAAITPKTRAIVPVHYAGVSCEMDRIMEIADKYKLIVIEDAAQGVNAFYKGKALGSIGHFGTYSFHETKNYIAGEGGALCINRREFVERAEIIRDKGTNRSQFFRGEIDKYTWVDLGSSYVPSEISCAFLFAQLEEMNSIADRRRAIYQRYEAYLSPLEDRGLLGLPTIPNDCVSNSHMFYILLANVETRDGLMEHLKQHDINAVFHYVPLHSSPKGQTYGYEAGDLPITEDLSGRLLRLPFYYDLQEDEQDEVVSCIDEYLNSLSDQLHTEAKRKASLPAGERGLRAVSSDVSASS